MDFCKKPAKQGYGRKAWETSPDINSLLGEQCPAKHRKAVSLRGHPLPRFEGQKALLLGCDVAAPGLQPLLITVQRGTGPVKSTFWDCSRSFPQPCPHPCGMQEWAPVSNKCHELKATFSAEISESCDSGSWSLPLPKVASKPILRRNVCGTLGYLPSGHI